MVHVIHVVADMMGSVADTMLGVFGIMHGVANMMCDAAKIPDIFLIEPFLN